jgi:ribosomal protein S18 acetylase RimI-like enzyme
MTITFRTTTTLNRIPYQALLTVDPQHPHIHLVDMPFRVNSTWQDRGCEVGVWEQEGALLAWAYFQPPWQVLDHAIHPSMHGTALEKDVFAWGLTQMQAYADRTGESFNGTIEYYEDTPGLEKTVKNLTALGFSAVDWSVYRYSLDLAQNFPQPRVADGYAVRSLKGSSEARAYSGLIDNVFGANFLPVDWRLRLLQDTNYLPELDIVIEYEATGELVGFCHCWLRQGVAQIEPLGVHPAHHRRGLGSALELAAFHAAQILGAHTMLVDHGSTNEGAIALSTRLGFRQINKALRWAVAVKPANVIT